MNILKKGTLQNFSDWYEPILEKGGVALINKEFNWTSFDVIAKLRKILKIKKIGHGGTLDPLATGLLIVCVGRPATRLADYYQDFPKEYHCKIQLGAITPTYDLESIPQDFKDYSHIIDEQIYEVLNSFVGNIEQVPPLHSAVKVNGKRAYELARNKTDFQLESRPITIYSIDNISINLPQIEFSVLCSKGTYIRTLANDIGQKLGCGAYLSGLVRTKISEFHIDDAISVDEIRTKATIYNETNNINIVQ